jgi:hypothetical protein
MRKLVLIISLLAILCAVAWVLHLNGKWAFLVRDRRQVVEVDGVVVDGDVHWHRFVALVTRRDAGRQHSYLLGFAGDIDPAGNIGSITDCHLWVAPRLPMLIHTHTYPPCVVRPDEIGQPWIWSLTEHGHGMKFVGVKFTTPDHDTVVVRSR